MSNFAYWISKSGEIMKPDSRHIGAVIKYPSKFGETKKTIQDTYDKHGEQLSSTVEGKAREEIMLRVIKRGYIRIRKGGTRRNQRWSIQVNKINSRINDYLWEWARQMLDSRVETDSFADVNIHQLSNNKMTKTSMNKIASGGSIQEGKRIYREDELNEDMSAM
jgi:ribosomal protein S6E (S10)